MQSLIKSYKYSQKWFITKEYYDKKEIHISLKSIIVI